MRRRATNLDPTYEAAENLVLHMTWVQARVPGMHARIDPGLALGEFGAGYGHFQHHFPGAAHRRRSGAGGGCRGVLPHARTSVLVVDRAGDEPGSLPSMLRSAGLREMEAEVAMAADLGALPKSPPLPEGLRIEKVRTAEALRRFAEINAANWSPADSNVQEFYDRAAGVLLGPGSIRLLRRVHG